MIPAFALYRRSRAEQDLSIEQQRAEVRAWAAEHGYKIVREFQDDASGLDTARRKDFNALLQVCTQAGRREADLVLVYDVSRFSRLEPDEAAYHEFNLRRLGVRVVYTHDAGANEAGMTGHLVKSLKRALAHEFSTKLSQLVRRGHRAHAALGHWSGGRPPYGYRRALQQPDGRVTVLESGRWKARGERVVLVVEPAEAETVRWVFDAYARRGLGYLAIVKALNDRGVAPPAGNAGAGAWAKSAVWSIVHNPIYQGDLVWGRARYREVGKKRGKRALPEAERITARDAVTPIVPRELWGAAQSQPERDGRRFGIGRPWHRPYLLSGLIDCGHCGKHFQAQKQYRGVVPAYYLCGGYVASGSTFCRPLRIPTTHLDEAVLDGIQKRLDRVVNPDELRRRLEAMFPDRESAEESAAALTNQLREAEAKINRLIDVLAGGADDLPSVRVALVTLERERERLTRQLQETKSRGGRGEDRDALVAELIDSLGDVRAVLEAGEPEERKAVVRSFLAGARVERDARRIVLRWYTLPRSAWVKMVAVGGIEPPTRGL